MIKNIKNFFLSFSVIFFIAAFTSFTAFNWKIMNNFQKLAIPAGLIILGLCFFVILKEEKYKNIALFFSCFTIGTLFAIYGQVYQTGANTWILFRNWGFFLIIPLFFTALSSIALLFIVVISLATYFYLEFYFSVSQAFFMSTLISAFAVISYPFFSKKLKFEFSNFFYNSLLIPFYIIFNIAGIFLIFDNNILDIIYPFILILIFLIPYRIYKKVIILPFSIISAGLCVWTFFSKTVFLDNFYSYMLYFLVSLLFFIGVLVLLIKNISSSNSDNEFMKKIFKIIGNFLKVFILLSGFGALISIIMLSVGSHSFLIIALILLGASFALPEILKFKEDKLEAISFFLGLISLNYFFIIKFNFDNLENFIFVLSSVNIIIYYLVWYFRKNRVMDLLFAPLTYAYFAICLDKFLIQNREEYLIFIIKIIGILLLPIQLVFEEKINKSTFKDRINRIFYGNNIGLLIAFNNVWSLWNFVSFSISSENFMLDKFLKYLGYFEYILFLILFVFIIFYSLKKDKDLLEQKNLQNSLIISLIFIAICCVSAYIYNLRYTILLILLYIYRKNKWTTVILNIALCFFVFYYYYSLANLTLLKKSYYMFATAFILLVAYIISKFFIKEEKEAISSEK